MKAKWGRLVCFLMSICWFLLLLAGCSLKNNYAHLCATVDSFQNSDNYVLLTTDTLWIGEKCIPTNDIRYNDASCYFFFCIDDGVYGYTYPTESLTIIDLLFLAYDSLEISFIERISLPAHLIAAEHYEGSFYFRTIDPATGSQPQIYTVFNPQTKETKTISADSLAVKIEHSADHNRSEQYNIMSNNNNIVGVFVGNRQIITQNETGERKNLTRKLLSKCKEGKILNNIRYLYVSGVSNAYEKNGHIYLLIPCTPRNLSDAFYLYVIVNYDFDTEEVRYHSSLLFEQIESNIVDMYIP